MVQRLFEKVSALTQTFQGWLSDSNSINMLVTGKTGSGKSSLINGIVGKEVAEEVGALEERYALYRGATAVRAFPFKYLDVDITIWDSPGLQDGLDKEEEYIRDIKRKGCANPDLVLYCFDMTDGRFRKEDYDAIRKLTIGLGKDIWKNAIFVMTFANYVRAMRKHGQKLTPDEEHKRNYAFFKQRTEECKAWLVGAIVKAGVDAKIAATIPIVPAGYDVEQELPDRDNWLSLLWYASILRMKERSKPALLKANLHRIKLSDQITRGDFDKPIHKHPIDYEASKEKQHKNQKPKELIKQMQAPSDSGHILNKLEIKVLSKMIKTYKNERLKQLEVLIQEAQNQNRDISREQVEKILRQNGLSIVADHLKESLKRGVENLYHYEAYERALEGALNLTLMYLKFLFLGPPRSGKTSTRRRLVQEIINLRSLALPSTSTGVAETSDVIIKRLISEYSTITNSNWQSIMGPNDDKSSEHEKSGDDIKHLVQLFFQLIATTPLDQSAQVEGEDKCNCTAASQTDESSKDSVIIDTQHLDISESGASDTTGKSSRTSTDVQLVSEKQKIQPKVVTKCTKILEEQTELDNAFTKLMSILQSDSPIELQQLLKELIMINMVDVGGQPALMEMLPALTNGPALYCLFFRLDQDLRKHYPVQYHDPHHKNEAVLKSSYCIEDTLYQALSSIACFSSGKQPDQASSRVLLFGTHKDKVDEVRISQIECELKESLQSTKIYKEGLLLKTSAGRLFFSVDNMDGDESEIMNIRTDIEGIIKSCFSATPIPASWLMFRIVLHLLNKPVVSLAQCEAIATRLSMPTSVQEALWFFHHKIGSIMYYPEIPLMRETVICDPQVIFDSISTLIIDRFDYSNRELNPHDIDEFYRNGQFTMAQIESKTEHHRSTHLSLEQLVETLKNLNALAEIKNEQDILKTTHTSCLSSPAKFIMPAVLKQASEEELSALPFADLKSLACPLMIYFEGGFVPFGVFCASIAHLITHQNSMTTRWQLCDGKIMKNKVTFSVDRAFYVTLISRLQYFEIQIHQHSRSRSKKPLSAILSIVKCTVVETIHAVISNMKYKAYTEAEHVSSENFFDLAFACCLGASHSDHLMKVIEDANGRYAECLKEGQETILDDDHLKWFNTSEDKEVEHAVDCHPVQARERPGILSIKDLTKVQNRIWDARAQWRSLGLGLDIDFNSLAAIELGNQCKPDRCFQEMLSEWLKKTSRPTWSALAVALKSPSVGYSHLAEEILSENPHTE